MSYYTSLLHLQLVGRRKSFFSGRGQPQYLINCKPVYEFKDGAQTSMMRKALFQNINKFPYFISHFSKKKTVKQQN